MDIKLNHVDSGSGTPLVLLHGNGESHQCFSNQIPVFSQKYRVVAVDTRGHGESPRGDAPFTLSQFADDLKALIDEMSLSEIYLLGFSDGANIAITFMLKYPGYVKKLVLNGANTHPQGVAPDFFRQISEEWRAECQACSEGRGDLHKKELLDLMVTEPNFSSEQLSSIKAPTLVLAGDNDMILRSDTELIASSIEGSELRIISGSHFILTENVSEYNKAVMDFLSQK